MGIHPRAFASTTSARAAAELAGCDAVMLAHFSTSRAAAAVQARLRVAVLAAPDAAVAKLRGLVSAR